MKNLDPKRARWIRVRMGILCGAMGLGLGGVVATAFRVQVEDGAAWLETAERQRQRRLHVEPKRGAIYDRNGVALAVSVEVPSVSADVVEMLRNVPPEKHSGVLQAAAARIAEALSLDPVELERKLSAKPRFVWLKRRVTSEEAAQVRALGDVRGQAKPLRGLTIEGEGRRYYPNRELLGPVLGFVAPDGMGKDGLELLHDEELRGRAAEIRGLRDRSGRLLFAEGATDESAFQGRELRLSIDQAIQHVAERELSAAQQTYETKGGTLVVVDPNTGELLAMASTPGFNPNDYAESDAGARRNRAISDRFEPGSVMKVFTVAGALAAGTLRPDETLFCENGTYAVGNVTVHDTHPHGWLTVTQLLAKSSNICALKVGLSLGEPRLYATLKRFGFGEPSGVALPGEAAGVLRPRSRPWYEVETANASFGQGITTTALQLAMAFSAIVNGGRLLEPVLVRRVTDAAGRVEREGVTRVRREVIPPHVARTVTEMLVAVTEEGGTGTEAAIPGYRVTGKTATAQKVDAATGKYSNDRYTSAFVGAVPAERPRLVVAVVLDEPIIGHYGGDLAGPVFRRVASAALRFLGVPPTHGKARGAKAREVLEREVAEAAALGTSSPTGRSGVSETLVAQAPPARATEAPSGAESPKPDAPPGAASVRVPDCSALSMREAVRTLSEKGFVAVVEGSGKLVRQVPERGSVLAKGSVVRLVFDPGA